MLDLDYLLKGITDGTVSIIDISTAEPHSLYHDTEPCKVKLNKKYDVVRVSRDKLENRYDFMIQVVEHSIQT